MFVYMLLREKNPNIIVEDFQRRWIIGCNISNLRLNTFTCEHSVMGRSLAVVLCGYEPAKV